MGLVSGRVFDEDGDPVSNATVDCIGFRFLDGVRRLDTRGRATTNDAGDFRLSISTAGKCAIRATPPSKGGYPVHERPIGQAHGNPVATEQEYVPTYYPQTAKPGTASAIDITPGAQISGINITLLRGATVQVKGQIKSQAAVNPAHMSVQLDGWDSENMYTVVDSKRGFQFTGLLPGSYSLFAVGDNGDRARVPIDVGDQNIEGLEVILQPPATIQGRVVFEGKGELKSRLPVLTITETTGMDARSAQVQDDLTFKFDAVTPGSYRLRVEGVSNTYVKRIRVGEQEGPEAPFDVIPAGQMFRLGANSLHHSQTPLGYYLRRMKAKLGPAGAITAAARKIAIIFYTMIKNQVEYDESIWGQRDALREQRFDAKLRKQAAQRGYKLVPIEEKPAA